MSADALSLLATLHQADSFFPAGGIAFSWGVEGLVASGAFPTGSDLAVFLRGQLEQRWAVFDRSALALAYHGAAELDAVVAVDRQVEAMTLARELREGSRRAGASLIGVHARIGTPGADEYRARIRSGAAPGHLPVMQGLTWRGAGLTLAQAEAASAHTFCVSLLGAAIRLGAIGHLHAQHALVGVRGELSQMLERPAFGMDQSHTFAPMIEIAAMRHEVQASRLFAN
jgi:urease accessory protein